MAGDPRLSRRAALKLTAVGGAGLVAAACTGGADRAPPQAGVGTTHQGTRRSFPEQAGIWVPLGGYGGRVSVPGMSTPRLPRAGDLRFANGGREWQPSGEPERVYVHDVPVPTLGKAIPYGVYDPGRKSGWVGVVVDPDTAAFAVQTLRRWWQQLGRFAYPEAERLLVCADAGGSNGYRVWAWRTELAGSPGRPGFRSSCVTCRRGPPSGTGSSTGCSAPSR